MMHKTITLLLSVLLDIEGFRFTSRGYFLKIISDDSLPWATVALLLAKSLK
jgi:hypothetical protein